MRLRTPLHSKRMVQLLSYACVCVCVCTCIYLQSHYVRNCTPTLLFAVKATDVGSRVTKSSQLVNHFGKASTFTTKVCCFSFCLRIIFSVVVYLGVAISGAVAYLYVYYSSAEAEQLLGVVLLNGCLSYSL